MPAQEEQQPATVKTWVLENIADVREFQDDMFTLGFVAKMWRLPAAPPAQQIGVQVDIPDRPNGPILIDAFGATVRAVTMGTTLVSIDKLATEEPS